MGKSKKTTVGYHYRVAIHSGLSAGDIDAYLATRGGNKTAWEGRITQSGTFRISAPNLWGGEKDQGGIDSDVDLMFGEPDQQVNPYLAAVFGPQQSAWRGVTTFVFKGGRYGAMNPYPQKLSHKIERILKGWDTECWYPEKARILISGEDDPGVEFVHGEVVFAGSIGLAIHPKFEGIAAELPANCTIKAYEEFGVDAPRKVLIWVGDTVVWQTPWLGDATQQEALDAALVAAGREWMQGPITSVDVYEREVAFPPGLTGAQLQFIVLNNGPETIQSNLEIRIPGSDSRLWAMNPAHILYYSRTQLDMGREPEAALSDASFRAAADWYHGQGFGLCTTYDPSAESVDEFERRIERVSGCSLSSHVDGLWYLDVANGEYQLDDLPILTDDDILEFQDQPTLQDSAANSVSVKYFDPVRKEAIVTPPVQAPALIEEFGTNHLVLEYLEIPSAKLSLRVAQRELMARITPMRAAPLKTTRKPYAWRRGTYFRLQSPKRRIADMVCILGEKSSGQLRSGAMSITATQDVYSLPSTTFVEVEEGVDTRPPRVAVPITVQRAFEAPYTEVVTQLPRAELEALPDDVGFLMAVAADPAVSRDFSLYVDDGTGFEETGDGDWSATALVNEAADFERKEFTLSGGRRLIEVLPGMPALWGTEIVRVDEINVITGEVTFGRACGDTVPVKHTAGERVWFYGVDAAMDLTEYAEGESLDVKLLTNTASAQVNIDSAITLHVDIVGRVSRPYPPAQFRVNGLVDPTPSFGTVTVEGVHRDRLLQADQLVDTEMAGIGPEAGTTYTVRYFLNGVLSHTDEGLVAPASSYTPTGDGLLRVEMESVRDGLTSLQRHVREFAYTVTEGNPLQLQDGTPLQTQGGETIFLMG